MEAVTQKHEDAHVMMLSDMFTAIPATTIRRYLRENGGDMERTAAALIEVNDKYVSDMQKKQTLTKSVEANPVNNPNASPAQPTKSVKDAIDSVVAEKQKQIAQLEMAVSRVDEQLAKNSQDIAPKANESGVAPTVFAAQKKAEAEISDAYEENIKTDLEKAAKNPNKTPVTADTFSKWKTDFLSKAQPQEKEPEKKRVDPSVMLNDEKAILGPKVDLTQSLARAVHPPSPAKFMTESSVLAAVLSHENAAIEQIQTQLTSAYQRIFAEVEAKMAVQQQDIQRLNEAQEAKDAEIKRLETALAEQEKVAKEVQEKAAEEAQSAKEAHDKSLKEVQEKLKKAESTIQELQNKLASIPVSKEDQIKASSQKVADSIRGTFDNSIGKALAHESAENASLEVNKIANAIKKEIAIAFLKELNNARKNGDETASLSQSSLGLSVLNPSKSSSPPGYATTSSGPSYASAVSTGNKILH